jgi:ArsR family transcriptional regulator
VVAVEPSTAMRARAAVRASALGNVELRRGRLEKLPVEDGWADAVLLCLSLGHTADPVAALADCARVLRPGGRIAVADVERHGDATLIERLGEGFAGFEPNALLGLLRAAGFERVRRVELPELSSAARSHARRGGTALIEPLRPLCAVGARPR